MIHRGRDVLVATHALPFLNLPAQDVEYLRVFRDSEAGTQVAVITADPVGELGRRAREAGLTQAQLVQLTRKVLFVEGEHDKRVLDHLWGPDLRADRVEILPLRGKRNASAIMDAEFVSRLARESRRY